MKGPTFKNIKEKTVKYYDLFKKKCGLKLDKKNTIIVLGSIILLALIVSGVYASKHFEQKPEVVVFQPEANAYNVFFGDKEIG